ncbi:MAG: riboflavin biosynthesis protein RibF [Planctomycetales bacterium 4484_123]|nr:MAG: riboflavin biosynthesis protein RibF [Planctomycetales bacterium 4484_123]
MSVEVIEDLEKLPPPLRRCVLTVGNFEGVHLGHQAILHRGRKLADAEAAALVAMTFDRPTRLALSDRGDAEPILPKQVKYRLLGEAGADAVVVMPASPALLAMDAEAFVREVVVGRLAALHVVEGTDFRFGRGRGGSTETLRALSGEGGYDVIEVAPVTAELPGQGRVRISSSLIRSLLADGKVADAALCLGRPFVLYGRVVGGEGRGRKLSFPTANVAPAATIVPGDGIYAAWAELGGQRYKAAVSIGNKPTFGSGERCIEANLIDAAGDFYGQSIALAFVARLRDQARFPDAGALRAQIGKDVERVRELCR